LTILANLAEKNFKGIIIIIDRIWILVSLRNRIRGNVRFL
jgi:hypothetical protein